MAAPRRRFATGQAHRRRFTAEQVAEILIDSDSGRSFFGENYDSESECEYQDGISERESTTSNRDDDDQTGSGHLSDTDTDDDNVDISDTPVNNSSQTQRSGKQ